MLSSGLRRKGVRPLDVRSLTCPASDEGGAATAETVSIWVVAAEAEGAAAGRGAGPGGGDKATNHLQPIEML